MGRFVSGLIPLLEGKPPKKIPTYDIDGACEDYAKAISLGYKEVKAYLNTSCFSKFKEAAMRQLKKKVIYQKS